MAEVPMNVAPLAGIALFGVAKGSNAFGPDYYYVNTMRYMFEGERSVVLCKASSLFDWAVRNGKVKEGAGSFFEFHDFGKMGVDKQCVAELCKTTEAFHCHASPGSCVYIPGDFYTWEAVYSDTTGLRYSFPALLDPCLDGLRRAAFQASGQDAEPAEHASPLIRHLCAMAGFCCSAAGDKKS